MTTTISQIMALCGAMLDPEAHKRWLATLPQKRLQERLAALQAEQGKPETLPRWYGARRAEVCCG